MTIKRAYSWLVGFAGLAAILVSAVMIAPVRSMVQGNVIALLDLPCCLKRMDALQISPVRTRLVAHAGGPIRGLVYTNSREALDENYARGFRVFELDFHWTSDERLVLVHDWPHTCRQFGAPPHVLSYKEFVSMTRHDGLHQLTFDDLDQWLHNHQDALVVTDTKASNYQLMQYLQKNGRAILPQLIIQIYRMRELQEARELGARAVWLSLYKIRYPVWYLSRISSVDAFVIPIEAYGKYKQPDLMKRIPFYVHSVPNKYVENYFAQLPGVYGFYVD